MSYMRNDGVMGEGGAGAAGAGRVTGGLLIAAAVLVFAVLWAPVASVQFGGRSWETSVWEGNGGSGLADWFSAVPYVLIGLVAGVTGILLVVGVGARRSVLFWVAAFAGGMVLAISSGDVMAYAQGFKENISPAAGFWVLVLAMLVAIGGLVSGLRDAVVSKSVALQETQGAAGGAADRVTGVFLLVAAVVELAGSFKPAISDSSYFRSIWRTNSDGSAPLLLVHFVLILIVVVVVAIALLTGAGARNPAVRAAGAAAAALIFTDEINGLISTFTIMGLNFWEYLGIGLVMMVLALLLSFAAAVAGLVAQSARPRAAAQPRASYAPMNAAPNPFAPAPHPFAPAPAANPFAPASSTNPSAPAPAANPFAPVPPTNPFAPTPPANPFARAQPAPAVEATVKIEPTPAAVLPPRMARVYDGKDADGRPVVDRPAVEGNTRTAVLAYLESAPIVLAARSFEQDEFAPGDRDVPLNFRTDGVWVWAGAVPHYLHKHGLAPEPELVRHIADRGFRVGEIGDAAQQAAIQVITGS
ncbi:hypothetical protein [Nocardia sp. CA-145437]|uniref:hypothetical protein n=1 Tax=Nocardia sp. CA-145437 TaxID=3239980 RepID=UPI003D99D6CC